MQITVVSEMLAINCRGPLRPLKLQGPYASQAKAMLNKLYRLDLNMTYLSCQLVSPSDEG